MVAWCLLRVAGSSLFIVHCLLFTGQREDGGYVVQRRRQRTSHACSNSAWPGINTPQHHYCACKHVSIDLARQHQTIRTLPKEWYCATEQTLRRCSPTADPRGGTVVLVEVLASVRAQPHGGRPPTTTSSLSSLRPADSSTTCLRKGLRTQVMTASILRAHQHPVTRKKRPPSSRAP